jgi:PAS domain S-box-containing protein
MDLGSIADIHQDIPAGNVSIWRSKNPRAILGPVAVLAVTILIFDLSLPLGVAAGVPYVALVLLGLGLSNPSHIYLLAGLGSILTVIGYFASPQGGALWIVLTNRALALFAIWITALLLASRMRGKQRLSKMFDLSPDMIGSGDLQGYFTRVNSSFERILGYKSDEFCDSPFLDYVHEDDLQETTKALMDAASGDKKDVFTIANRYKCKDGTHKWIEWKVQAVADENVFYTVGRNITERKKMDVALIAAKEFAENANQAKTSLLANMSHELRTPLNAVIGFSNTMKSEMFGPLDDKYLEYASDINASGEHLLNLITDILDTSAIEADKLQLNEENVDIVEVVETSIRLLIERADQGGLHLTSKILVDHPVIYADKRRLTQILLNLLSNAIKFTPPDGDVSLTVSVDRAGAYIFTVSDTGVGMDDKERGEAMSVFGQVDNALDNKHEGTGLGLPLTRGLVELHGGTFEINSQKGKGTTINVCFPALRTIKL